MPVGIDAYMEDPDDVDTVGAEAVEGDVASAGVRVGGMRNDAGCERQRSL